MNFEGSCEDSLSAVGARVLLPKPVVDTLSTESVATWQLLNFGSFGELLHAHETLNFVKTLVFVIVVHFEALDLLI